MINYRDVFKKPHTLLIVVHIDSPQQALRNSILAFKEGVDGIFLIDHDANSTQLPQIYEQIRTHFPDKWIGLNYLGTTREEAFKMLSKQTNPSGIWLDNAGYREKQDDPCEYVRSLREYQEKYQTNHCLVFGSVAFKYQRIVKDPAKAAVLTAPYIDVVTTSGAGTGIAADVGKIKTMKEAIPKHPLALASGVTPDNVSMYMPFVDCFLVSTGVSVSHTELDPLKLSKLVKAIN